MRRRRMNPRQRQGLLLVVISAAGLLGVFLLIANYVSSVSKQVGPMETIVKLVAPLSPYQQVSPDDLGEVSVPRKWAPAGAITDPGPLLGEVSDSGLAAGTWLEQGMLVPPPVLSADQREMTIMVDAGTGAEESLQPGDLVDVLATYQGSAPGQRNFAKVIVPGVRLLSVGQLTTSASGQTSEIPVDVAVSSQQVLTITYAQTFAQKITLAKIAPNSTTAAPTRPYVLTP